MGCSATVSRIVVVIPAYQAVDHLEKVLRGVPKCVSHVVVVDDASSDGTADVALRVARTDCRIRLVTHDVNQGVGGAMLTGYGVAADLGATVVVKMDGDGQMDPDYLDTLVAPVTAGEADYTKGNRFLHARVLRSSMPLLRRVGNVGLSFLTKLSSGYWSVFDPTNGYTCLHASLIPLLPRERIDRRYFFESSVLLELGLLRAVVRDVYIPARYGNERSFLSEWGALVKFPWLLLRGLLRRVVVQYFVCDFTATSLFLVFGLLLSAFGAGWGTFHWWTSAHQGVAVTTGTVMLAVLPLTLGTQLLLQALILDIQNSPSRPIHPTCEHSPQGPGPREVPYATKSG